MVFGINVIVISFGLLVHSLLQAFTIKPYPVHIIQNPRSILMHEKISLPPRFIGQRSRFATACGVSWFHQDRCLAVVNLGGQAIFTYMFDAHNRDVRPLQIITNAQGACLNFPENMSFHPDGTWAVLSNSEDNVINVYQVNPDTHYITPQPMHSFKHAAKTTHGISFSSRGDFLAITTLRPDGDVYIYKIEKDKNKIKQKLVWTIKDQLFSLRPKVIVFSHDDQYIIIGYATRASKNPSAMQTIIKVYPFNAALGRVAASPSSQLMLENVNSDDIKFLLDDCHVAIADQGQDKIYFYAFNKKNGVIHKKLMELKNPEAQLSFPHGIAFSSDSKFFAVTNFGNDTTCVYEVAS